MKLNYKQHLTMMKSTQEDCIAPSRKSKHINESERQQIEHWRLKGVSVAEIAMLLQRHRSTIYRELKRGTVINKRSNLSEFSVYRAQRAQDDYTRNSGAGGPYLKLSWNSKEAKRLCELMTVNKLSPYAAVEVARREKLNINFSSRSLYNYIHQYSYPITCEQLPMKNKRKKGSKSSSARLAHNNVKGDSIEKRPPEINERNEAGHWEMDLVVGAKGGKKVLLVLTERKTRYEYIVLLKDKSQKSVILALNKMERLYGARLFRETFKSITCDNGSEFLDSQSLEKSLFNKTNRSKLYYAHPFSSFERGSNENANRFIRRILPKKTTFDTLTQNDINSMAEWMNRYPRRIFNGQSARTKARIENLHFIKFAA